MLNSVEELVKRNKKENLVLSLIMFVICILCLILNINNYFRVITNNFVVVNSIDDLYTAIKNKERFITVDLKDATLEMYSLKKTNENNNIINLYPLTIDNKNVLVLISPNTMITDKVSLEILNDTKYIRQIKDKLENNNYESKVLSTIDYNFNRNIEIVKFYVTIFILTISIINIIFSIYGICNIKKHMHIKNIIKNYICSFFYYFMIKYQ